MCIERLTSLYKMTGKENHYELQEAQNEEG